MSSSALGSKRDLTPSDLHLHFLSPFIAYKHFTEDLPFPAAHDDVRRFGKAIESEILRTKVRTTETNALDMGNLQGDLSMEQLAARTKQEILSGRHALLLQPLLHAEVAGILHTGRLTLLQREGAAPPGHRYSVRLVASGGTARPQHVLQAAMSHYILSQMLGEHHGKIIKETFSIILGDGSEQTFAAADYQEVFAVHRQKCEELLKGTARAPEPVAQELTLQPPSAGIVRQRMKELGSLEAIPGLLPLQKRHLRKWASIRTLDDLVQSDFHEVQSFMSFSTFHRLRDQAKHILAGQASPRQDACEPEKPRGGCMVIDVIVGTHPSRSCILVGGGDGSMRVIHAEELAGSATPLASLIDARAGAKQVYFFDKQVRDELLLTLLVMGRASLARRVLEGIFCTLSWVELSAALRAAGTKPASYSFDGLFAALFGQSKADRLEIHSLRSLPVLLEHSRYGLLPKDQKSSAVASFEKLACGKVAALLSMAAWVQARGRNGGGREQCRCSNLRDDLLRLCDTFAQGRTPCLGEWPSAIRARVQKWPDVYRHDLFWKVLDVMDLDQLPEEEWAAHVLCLSNLKRIGHRYRENVFQGRGRPYNELTVEYVWSVEQETTIKETDDVLVRQDWSLRGKVKSFDPTTCNVTLVFDTNFRQNLNLPRLIENHFDTISVVQGGFNIKDGRNILTQAVEAKLDEIVGGGMGAQPRCFQKFLLRQALADAPLQQAAAKQVISRMRKDYTIIQGPPGAGKTYTSADIIQHMLKDGVASSVLVSSNSHKAIRNLLSTINRKFGVPVAKIEGNNELPEDLRKEGIDLVPNGREIQLPFNCRVIGGTASQLLKVTLSYGDYLFVDEAGQVTIELLAVIATKALNLVIVGDQNQLPPPVQPNVQPTGCGVSCMEYFTEGDLKVDDKCGFFLSVTYRMSDQLTGVISSNFYGGNLEAHPRNSGNRVVLRRRGLVEVETGAQFVPVHHEGNMQSSEEECQAVKGIVEQLLECQAVLDEDRPRPISTQDIIIVCPYNAQVMMIKGTLADDPQLKHIRVGSVDLFQGQEAAVAIVSLGSSSGGANRLGFVLDPKRTNVALSRGKALAVVVGSPALGDCRVETVQEVALQNRYRMWVKQNFTRSSLPA